MIRRLLAIAAALVLPLTWFVIHFRGLIESPQWVALSAGAGILGAAFLLSWASEVAQLDVPQALALLFLALVAVLPEYAVDVYFAWRAGRDPTYTAFATANMTGGNRLLLGVGWAVPVLAAWARSGRREVVLPREQAIEINYLALATLYSFVIPLKGTLSITDTAILFGIFLLYVRAASRSHHAEPDIEGPAAAVAALPVTARRLAVAALFAVAAAAIFTAAEPFAEGLIATGRRFGIEEFLLVQWLAPLASESPEFVVAVLFAVKGAAAAGIGTMVSSKVNQWTLLVGALPAAYALSHGSLHPMILDARQREEIFLTSAQSVFGLFVIANFRFGVSEALTLLVLFAVQLAFTSPAARWLYAAGYLALAAGMLLSSRDTRRGVLHLLPGTGA
ncbi:MAG TPA: sodium:calcium antiporter [Candidatus Binatia bacterium]|nr:sodium:calcium antiporter [Candidatus Binatia bacterium]